MTIWDLIRSFLNAPANSIRIEELTERVNKLEQDMLYNDMAISLHSDKIPALLSETKKNHDILAELVIEQLQKNISTED